MVRLPSLELLRRQCSLRSFEARILPADGQELARAAPGMAVPALWESNQRRVSQVRGPDLLFIDELLQEVAEEMLWALTRAEDLQLVRALLLGHVLKDPRFWSSNFFVTLGAPELCFPDRHLRPVLPPLILELPLLSLYRRARWLVVAIAQNALLLLDPGLLLPRSRASTFLQAEQVVMTA